MMRLQVWAQFDPDADGRVPVSELSSLVAELRPPLGVKDYSNRRALNRLCISLNLAQHDGFILFTEVREMRP